MNFRCIALPSNISSVFTWTRMQLVEVKFSEKQKGRLNIYFLELFLSGGWICIHYMWLQRLNLSFLKRSICSISKIVMSCTCLSFWQQINTLISFTVNTWIYYIVTCRADVSKNVKKFQSVHVDVVALVFQNRTS